MGHLLYSDHAALPSGSSPTMPYSDFPGSRHSPGSLSSITAFGKMCLRPQVPLNRAVQPCSGFLQRRCVPSAGPTAAVAWRNSSEARTSPGSAQVCPPWGRPVAPGRPSLPSPSLLPRPHLTATPSRPQSVPPSVISARSQNDREKPCGFILLASS